MDQITIKEILKAMDEGQIFSLSVVAYNRQRKTGGQILSWPEAVLVEPSKEKKRKATKMEELKNPVLKRGANHRKWYTRNIRIFQDGQPTGLIKKIHPPLIIEFNKLKVVP